MDADAVIKLLEQLPRWMEEMHLSRAEMIQFERDLEEANCLMQRLQELLERWVRRKLVHDALKG